MAAGGGSMHQEGLRGLPAPPLSLRSFKYATKREDRARGRGGETQNTGEEEVGRRPGLEMSRERRVQRGWGQGWSLRGPPLLPPLLQRPQKEPLMSVCPEEPREQVGYQPPPLLQPGLQSWGLCQ